MLVNLHCFKPLLLVCSSLSGCHNLNKNHQQKSNAIPQPFLPSSSHPARAPCFNVLASFWASQGVLLGKNQPANAEDINKRPGFILCQEDPLEEGMGTHSSILAWRIPWTEKPGRLQFSLSHLALQMTSWTPYPQPGRAGLKQATTWFFLLLLLSSLQILNPILALICVARPSL